MRWRNLWRRAGRSRCRFVVRAGEGGCPDWPQRRRQETTTFNLINGQIRPDQGEVMAGWPRYHRHYPPQRLFRQGVRRTFQITATFGSMTVRENDADGAHESFAGTQHRCDMPLAGGRIGQKLRAYSLIAEQGCRPGQSPGVRS